VVDRHVDLLEGAVLLGPVDDDELARVVDVEGSRVLGLVLAVLDTDPEAFPAGVAGFDVVADRRFEARLYAAGRCERREGNEDAEQVHVRAIPSSGSMYRRRCGDQAAASLTRTASASTKSPA